jgi:pimeloyl-ACP methyl ester carboxylesterase
MYVFEQGTGADVIVLHGANPVDYFDALVAALVPNHRVLVPHMPGWGKSPEMDAGQDYTATNAALREALAERGVTRAAVVGYSLGGWRALELALSGSFDVTGVYLLSTFTASPTPEVRERYREYAELARSESDMRPAVRDLYLAPDFAARNPEIHRRVTEWVYACPRDVFARELDAIAEMPDLGPSLPDLVAPVVARSGTLDTAAPPHWSREIVEAVPDGRLELAQGCGHALLYEDREATIGSILSSVGG